MWTANSLRLLRMLRRSFIHIKYVDFNYKNVAYQQTLLQKRSKHKVTHWADVLSDALFESFHIYVNSIWFNKSWGWKVWNLWGGLFVLVILNNNKQIVYGALRSTRPGARVARPQASARPTTSPNRLFKRKRLAQNNSLFNTSLRCFSLYSDIIILLAKRQKPTKCL